jgi:hypothetical protein
MRTTFKLNAQIDTTGYLANVINEIISHVKHVWKNNRRYNQEIGFGTRCQYRVYVDGSCYVFKRINHLERFLSGIKPGSVVTIFSNAMGTVTLEIS